MSFYGWILIGYAVCLLVAIIYTLLAWRNQEGWHLVGLGTLSTTILFMFAIDAVLDVIGCALWAGCWLDVPPLAMISY